MKEISKEARERFYAEVGRRLIKEGIAVLPEKDGLMPLEWNGASLCRITAGGGAQYCASELEPEGAEGAFWRAADLAKMTAEYLYLYDRSDEAGKCWPGVKRIAADLHLSRRTVQRALVDLERGGYISRRSRRRENGSQTSNLYTVVKHHEI